MAGEDRSAGTAPEGAVPDETPDLYGAYPRLTDEQITFLAGHGTRQPVVPGQVLIREGDQCTDFYVILSGSVAIIEDYGTPDERVLRVHGPGRFLGELGLLQGQVAFYTARSRQAGEVLAVPVDRLRVLVARDPVLGDLILRAYLGRRSLLVGAGAGFRILGSRYSPDTRRLREFAARNRLPHRWIDLETDQEAEALLRRFSISPEDTPIVIWRDHQVLRNPDNAELARLIGLSPPVPDRSKNDLLVVGCGPAGIAAAVYGSSDGLSTTVVDAVATGGQASTSSLIENYFGFPTGVSGSELAERGVLQARKFGAQVRLPVEATSLEPSDGHYRVTFADGSETLCRTVVLATGAHYRRLKVPGIERLEGASVYYAATVYEAQQCGADPVAVVGGGNSAGQAVLFLAQRVPRVHLLIRGPDLGAKMSRYLVDQIERHPRVTVALDTEIREVRGDDVLRSIVVEQTRTGERRTVDVRALFVFIGAKPCTDWLADVLALDDRGFVLTGAEAEARSATGVWEGQSRGCLSLETSLPGVFAAGDVRSGSVKRVASAAGEGAMAVHHIHDHLAHTTADPTRPNGDIQAPSGRSAAPGGDPHASATSDRR
ncbi:cyclic nucleotide-binding domain-containing thioredoxin-disulfide reductase [Streptomyces sp. PSAA01]|uniref:FAD-dependent oxidoreductase n=1 Tax=Streptomyces sp. PSAA01 TaxID=2912762 RepID=UPI001F1BAABB|nr:cyclic nucleotide-binding domain-containing thioredoxin-disulfide reductase [Streptomyces sp. PSAA01]MCG0288257.1 FAD-dependent oxidoreductase [Streptomyces sp. PSAA01]